MTNAADSLGDAQVTPPDFDAPTPTGEPAQRAMTSHDAQQTAPGAGQDTQQDQQPQQQPPPVASESESDRVRNLMSALGRKETERHSVATARDAAVRERDEARAELARLKAENDAQQSAWSEQWAKVPPVYRDGLAPTSPMKSMSVGSRDPNDPNTMLQGLEATFRRHMDGLSDH